MSTPETCPTSHFHSVPTSCEEIPLHVTSAHIWMHTWPTHPVAAAVSALPHIQQQEQPLGLCCPPIVPVHSCKRVPNNAIFISWCAVFEKANFRKTFCHLPHQVPFYIYRPHYVTSNLGLHAILCARYTSLLNWVTAAQSMYLVNLVMWLRSLLTCSRGWHNIDIANMSSNGLALNSRTHQAMLFHMKRFYWLLQKCCCCWSLLIFKVFW